MEAAIASLRSLSESSMAVLGVDMTSTLVGISSSIIDGVGAGADFGGAGVLVNMSRILLLFVNSARSFPLSAGTSLTMS